MMKTQTILNWALCCGLVVTPLACTSTKTTNTARTAREQLLISNAIDHALEKVDLSTIQGTNLYIEEKYLEGVDKAYLVGSLRHRAMLAGANIVTKAEDADIVLELRSGSIGTDSADSFIGSPEITLPGMLTLPEVRLVSRSRQTATAKLGLLAYDPKSKQLLGQGGVSSAQSDDNNVFVFGVGPYHYGTVKEEVERTATPPATTAQQLPSQVAFRGTRPMGSAIARDVNEEGSVQLTGDQRPAD
ncbi:hypothetical protein Spb1_39070 [Planctopirus ephydatiae]|uniref:Uncharacterized protein n=1 Tax=Planctopirus ephydatiae TaxID=2528019 RepID=A0A518GTP9_9PLAN|nr:DUF6655 family protein [Planctopirus ephydatiae]QDV31960.1 hypothetical protein Spb1_39070 [Planctopirus ephydatiae]